MRVVGSTFWAEEGQQGSGGALGSAESCVRRTLMCLKDSVAAARSQAQWLTPWDLGGCRDTECPSRTHVPVGGLCERAEAHLHGDAGWCLRSSKHPLDVMWEGWDVSTPEQTRSHHNLMGFESPLNPTAGRLDWLACRFPVWPQDREEEEGSRQTVALEKELVGWPPHPVLLHQLCASSMGTDSVVLLGSRRQLESRGGRPTVFDCAGKILRKGVGIAQGPEAQRALLTERQTPVHCFSGRKSP